MPASAPRPLVLLVEGDADQRALLAELLTLQDLTVHCAAGVAEAHSLLEYQLVILDYALPDGFADELFARDDLDPEKTVMVSGHGPSELNINVPFFRKPIDWDEFTAAIRKRVGRADDKSASRSSLLPGGDPTIDGAIELILYTGGQTAASAAARSNLAGLLATYDQSRITVQYVDLVENPDGVLPDDRVLFTPTLVRRRPAPRAWVVGDLTDQSAIRALLTASGIHPAE